MLLFLFAFFRAYLYGSISLASFVVSSIAIFALFIIVILFEVRTVNILQASLVYILIVICLGTLRFESAFGNIRVLEIVNLQVARANSYLFGNFAYSSMLFGILSGWSLIIKRKFHAFVFITILVLLDSRTAILALPIALILARMEWRLFSFLFGIFILPAIMFVISFLYIDLNLLSYRNLIWATIINGYSPSLNELLIGYGYLGQLRSGLSELYGVYFVDRGSYQSLLMSPHNSLIQGLLDYGIFGYLVILSFVWKLFFNLSTNRLILFGGIYLLLSGGFEIVLMPPNFVSLLLLCVMVNEKNQQSKYAPNIDTNH
jgi:hypothetical protein